MLWYNEKYLLNIVKNHNSQNNIFHKLCSNTTKYLLNIIKIMISNLIYKKIFS